MHTAIETTATLGKNRLLILDDDIPARESEKVRVIVLIDEDLNERLWHRAADSNEAFEFLSDESEDIYSFEDGSPLSDEA